MSTVSALPAWGEADRRVRRLHLRGPDGDTLARARIALADALRTASIDTPGRLVVVRRLDLGTFGAHLSPTALALLIERRMWTLATEARAFDDPQAEAAGVVWFPDAIQPLVEVARHLAAGRHPKAWFWAAAVPGLAQAPDLPTAIRRVLQEAFAAAAPVLAVAEVLEALIAAGGIARLVAALTPADGPALLERSGWLAAPPASPGALLPAPLPTLPRHWQAALREAAAQWRSTDARWQWLTATALVAQQPTWVQRPAALAQAAEALVHRPLGAADATSSGTPPPSGQVWGATVSPDLVRPSAVAPPDVPAAVRVPGQVVAEPAPAKDAPEEAETSPKAAAKPGLRLTNSAKTPVKSGHSTAEPMVTPTHRPRPRPTDFGGLYFLVRPLVHLGLPAALEAEPVELGVHLFTHLAGAAGAEPDDPILTAPVELRPPPADLHARLAPWLEALDGWLLRFSRGELDRSAIIRRPGAVITTRTHLDVLFDLDQADLAIRRLGLDLNPGYVPWLGRVFTFHYLVGGRLDD